MKSGKSFITLNGIKIPFSKHDPKKKLNPKQQIPLFTIAKGKDKAPVRIVSVADLKASASSGISGFPSYGYQLIERFTPQYGSGVRTGYGRFRFLSSILPDVGMGTINGWRFWRFMNEGLLPSKTSQLSFDVDLSSARNRGAKGFAVLELLAEGSTTTILTVKINNQTAYLQFELGLQSASIVLEHINAPAPVKVELLLERALNPAVNNGTYYVTLNLGYVDLYETIYPPDVKEI